MASKPRKTRRQLRADPATDPLAAWPFPDSSMYFMSGSNNPIEIEHAHKTFQNVGTAAPETNATVEAALKSVAMPEEHAWLKRGRFARPNDAASTLVFVDSGAFSEVKFGPSGPTWPKPITDAEWNKRLDKYDRLADALGPQLFAVAPDKVADQDATLERQVRYADRVQELKRKGANILVPVQKGRMKMADFYQRELEAMGLEPGAPEVYAAIPLKKDATSLEDLEEFVADTRKRFKLSCDEDDGLPVNKRFRVHLLGRGVYSPDYFDTFDAVKRACPTAIITSDSVRIRAMVGENRPITQALKAAKALGITDARKAKAVALRATDALVRAVGEADAHAAGWFDPELDSGPEQAAQRKLDRVGASMRAAGLAGAPARRRR